MIYKPYSKKHVLFINLGLTFKAVSSDGDLIGVITNEIIDRNNETRSNCTSNNEDQEGSLKFNEFMKLFQKIEQESNMFERYTDVNRVMDIKAVAVNEKFRGQGVCKALFYKCKYVSHTLFLNSVGIYF
jgi:arylalkylamine N-acetyltransferase